MPMLLQELVEETSKSNRWAERFDAEARQFEGTPESEAALQTLRETARSFIMVATEFAISRASRAEEFWRSTLTVLGKGPTEAISLLRTLLQSFETSLSVIQAVVRERPKIARTALITESEWQERLDELDQAERKLLQMAADAKKALQYRTTEWKPADPDRFAEGLRLSREGKGLSIDEVRARFSRTED